MIQGYRRNLMKKNTLLDIIEYWYDLSEQEKVDLLQRFEEENSKFQNRKARELVVDKEMKKISGAFKYSQPNQIFIQPTSHHNGTYFANTIIHEGYHAYVFDHMRDLCDLTFYGKINKRSFYLEEEHLRGIQELCSKIKDGKKLNYFYNTEEQIVRKETALHMIYNLLKNCESKKDIIKIIPYYTEIMETEGLIEIEKEKFNEQQTYNLLKSVCYATQFRKTDLNISREIHDNTMPEFVRRFESSLQSYIEAILQSNNLDKKSFGRKIAFDICETYDEIQK